MSYSNLSRAIALFVGVVVTTFLISCLVWAWTGPGATPPEENVPAPLNVGIEGQAKSGGLMLNTGGAATGLIVLGNDTNPVGGVCPSGYDWYDYDNDGVKDDGECQKTSLYSTADGKLAVGTKYPEGIFQVNGGKAVFCCTVGIGTTSPATGYSLDVEGKVQATSFDVGDITFRDQETQKILWRMFEDEDGLYLESLKTGKIYRFVLEEITD